LKKISIAGVIVLIGVFLLTACGSKSDGASSQSPEAVFTAAAQTAEARRLLLPTVSPTIFADALIATSKALTPTSAVETSIPSGATSAPQATVTKVAPGSLPVSANDRAEFVDDVTVPDGTTFAPNDVFVKTWQLKNTGTTTWNTDYALIFIDGDLLGSAPTIPLQAPVAPGEAVNLSIELTAPAKDGTYKGFWKLLNASGEVFGVGPDAIDAFWFIISVSQSAAPAATTTPTPQSGTVLTSAILAVDNANFQGACPHTFVFTGYFTLSKPSTVTYSIETENDSGAEINLPQPTTRNLEAGTHSIFFELVYAKSLKGWARLNFIAPEVINSNQVNFTLTCQ
jgi:hypothetical protein